MVAVASLVCSVLRFHETMALLRGAEARCLRFFLVAEVSPTQKSRWLSLAEDRSQSLAKSTPAFALIWASGSRREGLHLEFGSLERAVMLLVDDLMEFSAVVQLSTSFRVPFGPVTESSLCACDRKLTDQSQFSAERADLIDRRDPRFSAFSTG